MFGLYSYKIVNLNNKQLLVSNLQKIINSKKNK